MSQRISDEKLAERIQALGSLAYDWGVTPESVICMPELLDLRDARAELAEMKRFSASQEEAHAARDRGVSL